MIGRDRQPCAPIAREQVIGSSGPGAAGGIIGKILGRGTGPSIDQSLNGTPAGLDRVGPLEQCGVPDQAIIDQRLVPDRGQRREIVPVGEVHFDPVDLDIGAGPLGAEAERQPLVRLDAEHQDIWGQSLDRGIAKKCIGRLTKLHRNFRGSGGKVLAGAQIERHTGPAPIIDAELERDIGFRCRIRRDVGLAPVIANVFAEHNTCPVLATHGILRRDRMNCLEQLRLLAAHGIRVE